MSNTEKNLEIIRHSFSHVLAAAVNELWSEVKFAIGPAIDNGFYYDFDFGEIRIGEEHLAEIEKVMLEIINKNLPFVRSEADIDDAIKEANEKGEIYKADLLTELKNNDEKKVSFYTLGEFKDLCRGPHVENTKDLPADGFKLHKLAGAYWRGDEKNIMLTRIYGLAFENKKALEEYLHMLKEAEKRDHRKIGKELDLFSIHEEAPGMPFFHPKGTIVYNELKNFWIESQAAFEYENIICPSMLDVAIWKKSGHWDHYKDDMYFIESDKDSDRQFALRPMDCPGAILVYNNSLKSYRDLPIRYAEPGLITRKEKSGQLGGLLRVQQFVQDDAHIFIAEEQIEEEIKNIIKLVDIMYKPFGLEYRAFLSTRPDDFMGDAKSWDKAEKALTKILTEVYGKEFGLKEKDGAFYGPKIDFQLKDCIGRTWQCATIQLDFQMPEKFNCIYIDNEGREKNPVLIHRTILGSFERFMGIIIEHYAGAFPVWLSPVQVKIISVSSAHIDYCRDLCQELREQKIRVEVDDANETVGNKIRKAVNEKVPYMLVIGDKEMGSENLMVRDRGSKETREIGKKEFIGEIKEKVRDKK
jgi:threonyl-tRNA synthetase